MDYPGPVKALLVGGARPNFMKLAPIYHAMRDSKRAIEPLLVHTGQHYDANMSDRFFQDLGLPAADYNLGIGSGSHAEQTAAVMVGVERICRDIMPDWVVVVGDVNSTMAATLAAKKLNIRVAHVEAGLRSGDRTMPEEINRLVTDSVADLLLTPSMDANENLLKEGVSDKKIRFVGNVMIDSFVSQLPLITRIEKPCAGAYGIVTLHRPSNVDTREKLSQLVDMLLSVSSCAKLVCPIHPRTRAKLIEFSLMGRLQGSSGIDLCDPVGYVEFMGWVSGSSFVLTDSGGLQEETTYLGIPCFTLRSNTERPITITEGTNILVTVDTAAGFVEDCIKGNAKQGKVPHLWDGAAATRIVEALEKYS